MSEITNEVLQRIFPLSAKNIAKNWPLVQSALEHEKIATLNCQIAAAATIAVETARTFAPVKEFGGDKYLNRMYDQRTNLGNTPELDGDGARYCGRGFIQITGKRNYEHYSLKTNADLVNHPELAQEPILSAHILALYFIERGVDKAANEGNWEQVRRRVNGGLNGFDVFMRIVNELVKQTDVSTTTDIPTVASHA